MNRPDEHEGLSRAREPGLGAIEILVGQEDVLPHLVDQGSPPEAPDAVPGHRAQELTRYRHDDDDRELQRLALARNLPTGQDPPVIRATSAPTGRPMAETKLSTKITQYPADLRNSSTPTLLSPWTRRSSWASPRLIAIHRAVGGEPLSRGRTGGDDRAGGGGRGRARFFRRGRGGAEPSSSHRSWSFVGLVVAKVGLGDVTGVGLVVGGAVGGSQRSRVLPGHRDPDEHGGTTGDDDRRSGQPADPCLCPGAGAPREVVSGPPHGEPGCCGTSRSFPVVHSVHGGDQRTGRFWVTHQPRGGTLGTHPPSG